MEAYNPMTVIKDLEGVETAALHAMFDFKERND
jgi:hypothetical protein